MIGPKILEGLLRLEAADNKRKFLAVALILLVYYSLHIFVIEGTFQLHFVIVNDAVAAFTLYSLVWSSRCIWSSVEIAFLLATTTKRQRHC
mmetsp:Transcript_25367/g.42162  ORF Transcript_25367/g.42162 Transcript_25367/m.42162 type:complete len:91 (-) Transcript_25367:1090-1362(-)